MTRQGGNLCWLRPDRDVALLHFKHWTDGHLDLARHPSCYLTSQRKLWWKAPKTRLRRVNKVMFCCVLDRGKIIEKLCLWWGFGTKAPWSICADDASGREEYLNLSYLGLSPASYIHECSNLANIIRTTTQVQTKAKLTTIWSQLYKNDTCQ